MNSLPGVEKVPAKPIQRPGRGRLVRRTFIIAIILSSSGLIVGGSIELFFQYRETAKSIWLLQTEMAKGAAFKIHQFVQQIETTLLASTQTQDILDSGLTDAYEFQLLKLMKIVPAITTIVAVDDQGHERYKVSRIKMVRPEDLKDRSKDKVFLEVLNGATYFGPVYFVQDSEPYAQIAVPIKRFNKVIGALIAEVNLKHIWDVVSEIRAGRTGYAYVVSKDGDLIAHPDISLVLKDRNLISLTQVQTALNGVRSPIEAQVSLTGEKVFPAYTLIPDLGWAVLVERSTDEAYAPLYSSLLRTSMLVLTGLGMAGLASLLIGIRVVRPLEALRQGASRIGSGELDHRIDVKTGDELEELATEFNLMRSRLRESYAINERISHLKRFFSPQLAEYIVSSREEELTQSHRSEITVVFCDLRNFTAFSSITEPEETMQVLHDYYDVVCKLIRQFEATIEHFAGDGLMAFFNDPMPCPDPEERAVKMAILMQQEVGKLITDWRKSGTELGFGIGISSGYATLGHIGSAEQFHYAAIGSVANLASRLCDQAENGQILISESVFEKTLEVVKAESIGELSLKGFPNPVPVMQLTGETLQLSKG
jgi:adenylate cyclase